MDKNTVFQNRLADSDCERLDTVLSDLSADGFNAESVTDRTLARLGLYKQPAPVRGGLKLRSRLRLVLIAACVAVLLLATFVTAKTFRNRSSVDLVRLDHAPKDVKDATIALGYSGVIDGHTFTLVDMIADRQTMIFELSTDYTVDAPDGWLHDESSCPYVLNDYHCSVTFPDGGPVGMTRSSAPFARDGKLWYILTYHATNLDGADISHLPVHVRIGELTFDWVNDYEPKDRILRVNLDLGQFVLEEINLTVYRMTLHTHSTAADYECVLDSITLKDGTTLYYTCPTHSNPQDVAASGNDDQGGKIEDRYYNLLEGFSTTRGGDPEFVAIEDIASITVNGVEIPLE